MKKNSKIKKRRFWIFPACLLLAAVTGVLILVRIKPDWIYLANQSVRSLFSSAQFESFSPENQTLQTASADELLQGAYGCSPGTELFLVNENHPLPSDYAPELTVYPDTDVQLSPMLTEPYRRLAEDISSRFGMADIIPWTGTDYNKDAGFFTKLLTTAGGVTGSTIAQTFNNLANGEGLLGAARAISPTLGNIYWAAFAGERTDARGRITNKYDDVWSKLLRAMGFRSLEESLALDVQSLKYSEMERTSNEKQKAVDAYLDAEADGKPLGEYARRLRELGVKKSTVKKARDARKKDRMQRSIDKDVPDYAKGAMNLW